MESGLAIPRFDWAIGGGCALRASRRKIIVFIGFVLITVTILGTVMYLVEGPENGFTSIPVAIYWGITTMTTVGFGDIAPKTNLGRFIASCTHVIPGAREATGSQLIYSAASPGRGILQEQRTSACGKSGP